MKLKPLQTFLYLLLIFLFACNSNRWEVDTDKISIELPIERFDLDLFDKAENGIQQQELEQLLKDYPKFYPLFVGGVMGFGTVSDPQTAIALNDFTRNKDMQELHDKVKEIYPEGSLSHEQERLEKAFKYFHFHFPNRAVPKLVGMISSVNYNTVTDDSLLGIGLDMYLGGDYPIYGQIGIPKYKFKNYERDYIVSDAMKAWLLTEFREEGSKNLLQQMVFYGKVLYLTEVFLDEEAHLLFNYDKEELDWCEENESQAWFHFVDMELLFATENHKIRKYMGDAPFVAGFPEGSPGRVGHWVGYKIVESFMENNKEYSLADLMNNKDANQILRQSNYKPKR